MDSRILRLLAIFLLCTVTAGAWRAASPNGRIVLEPKDGRYVVSYQRQQVLTLEAPFSETISKPQRIKDDYRMISGKRLHCTNVANEYRLNGGLVLRLYNDGLAFRYEQPSFDEEPTAYIIPEGTRRWMQQWTDSYEGFFPLTTSYKTKAVRSFSGVSQSPEGWNNRWGYPALLEPADGIFALITEANIGRHQCASCLRNDGECYRVVPDKSEASLSEERRPTPNATTAEPAASPWRVVIIGRLADVVESTLVTDVSEPSKIADTSWIRPGVVSWVYWAYNHGSNDLGIISKYVDLAAKLHLPYVLIDAEWDQMKDGKTVEDAIAYAREQGVRPMIWYNSSVGWVDGAPTPKFRLNKAEDREREFAWCEKLGVAGVKVDFFSGDNRLNMDYCQDLMETAARHHMLINFHGATIPRGWQRTWPNLLTTEAVYGAEWYNNVPTFTERAASHNATLPFTRNVIGPMDYTPCAFSDSQHPHITTHAHELALTVLFESGLQHLADRPESFLAQPEQVQRLLQNLPAAWDETRYVAGYPGESAVLARRSGKTWFVAGINGKDTEQTVNLPLKAIVGNAGKAYVYADSSDKDQPWNITTLQRQLPTSMTCLPRGGFLIVVNPTF